MAAQVTNTDAQLNGKTLVVAENNTEITGQVTYNRGAAAPFAVDAASTMVPNLDADKLDGQEGAYYTTGVGAMETRISNTETGTKNDWAPAGLSGNTLIVWAGTDDAAITGIAGGVNGQRVTIKHNGTAGKVLTFAHNSASSAAGNKLINIATSGATPVALGGYITYQYDATGAVWRLVTHEQGAPITPAFSEGDYTATGGGTFTVAAGDVTTFTYVLRGKQLFVTLFLSDVSIAGTVSRVSIKLPGGFTAAKFTETAGTIFDNSVSVASYSRAHVSATDTTFVLLLGSGANLSAATDNTHMRFVLSVEVT